jgi:hypothetical protein
LDATDIEGVMAGSTTHHLRALRIALPLTLAMALVVLGLLFALAVPGLVLGSTQTAPAAASSGPPALLIAGLAGAALAGAWLLKPESGARRSSRPRHSDVHLRRDRSGPER